MANAINYETIMEELGKPFDTKDIEWRVQSATNNNGKYKVLVLPYITSRAVMNRLDQLVGPYWKDEYEPVLVESAPALRCTLSLKIGDEWISREDAAELSKVEPVKGGYSNSLKRCGVKWGIGRYLYNLPQFWVDLTERGEHRVYGDFKVNGRQEKLKGYFSTPKFPLWALPPQAPNNQQQKGNTSQNQNQKQQAPNNQNQRSQQPGNNSTQQNTGNTIPMSEAERKTKAIMRVNGHLQYLGIPINLVPQLMEKAIGTNVPFEEASAAQLGKLYHVLNPTKVYVENCTQFGLDMGEMLYYANITLAPVLNRPLENVYELPFYMTVDFATKTIALVKEDKASSTQQQIS